jgi:hypothetical protein
LSQASDPATLRDIHARLLHDRALQFDFSQVAPLKPLRVPDWLIALSRFLASGLNAALPVLKIIFWAGLGVAVLLVGWLILRELLGVRFSARRKARAVRAAPADWAPDPRRARALLENADRLAAQGRFDLAVRLILHRGVEDIEDRRPRLVRPALTARDIASLGAVPPAARAAFTRIAAIVEYGAFAGQPINRAAFAQCREAYQAFAVPQAWA